MLCSIESGFQGQCPVQKDVVFGRNKEPHTIIIAQGRRVRHFTIKPWLVATCGAVLAALYRIAA